MEDKEFLALMLENEDYPILLEKYGTKDLSLIAELIIKEGKVR